MQLLVVILALGSVHTGGLRAFSSRDELREAVVNWTAADAAGKAGLVAYRTMIPLCVFTT